MMGIVMPETCWASNKICNKNLCCIYLAFYFHILTTMHGQNHIKGVPWLLQSVVWYWLIPWFSWWGLSVALFNVLAEWVVLARRHCVTWQFLIRKWTCRDSATKISTELVKTGAERSIELWVYMVEPFRHVVYDSNCGSRIKEGEQREVRKNNLRLEQALRS